LETSTPKGKSSFREAYVWGIGMLLNLNSNYMARAANSNEKVLEPQYLHIVIASEDDDSSCDK
jgi:hypothetical protein